LPAWKVPSGPVRSGLLDWRPENRAADWRLELKTLANLNEANLGKSLGRGFSEETSFFLAPALAPPLMFGVDPVLWTPLKLIF